MDYTLYCALSADVKTYAYTLNLSLIMQKQICYAVSRIINIIDLQTWQNIFCCSSILPTMAVLYLILNLFNMDF